MTAELERVDHQAVSVDRATLQYLGYDPDSIATRALVLVAERFGLDPLLGEVCLIKTNAGVRVYVSRDGMLAAAHRSGLLDGIEVEQRRNSTNDGWTAFVSVWRRDMTHAFRYGAQCKDSEPQAKAGNGPEMALARAERRALKRAFRIASDFYPDRPDQDVDIVGDTEFDVGTVPAAAAVPASAHVPAPDRHMGVARSGDWDPDGSDQAEARTAFVNWNVKDRLSFLKRHRIEQFDEPWPPEAIAEVLAGPAVAPGRDDAGPVSPDELLS